MIEVFSGTGNSLAVAREISRRLGDRVGLLRPGKVIPPGSERIIWVFPVYSWGLPPVVANFIRSQRHLGGREHYCVLTCGDDVGLADKCWRKAMVRAGADDLRAVCSVKMPNTYVCLPGFDVDSPDVTAAKLAAMPVTVGKICEFIERKENVTDVIRGGFAWLKSWIIYPFFKHFMMSPKQFHTTAACTTCGLCASSCPLGNITMDGQPDGQSPRWHDHCTLCLCCYHICPRHAVAYGKSTATKGQKKVIL